MVTLDPVREAVVWLIRNTGYAVDIRQDNKTFRATAEHPGGERYEASGADPYSVACELAERCGIELEDG